METDVGLKSRMRENRTYGSVRGSRQAFHMCFEKGVSRLSTRRKLMSTVIKLHDKRSGNTYFYESESYWDREKQQPRSRRKLIGKLDPVTGKMVPTDGRGRGRNKPKPSEAIKPGPVPVSTAERRFYGATYLLDQIGNITGITADLKACFPENYKKLLSVAYFLILEDTDALSRFNHFDRTHRHPEGKDIPSQRSSELFQSITEDDKEKFFRLQGRRRIEKEYWAYDTTSISSYPCMSQ